MLTSSDTLLFQGDSITDAGRNREMAKKPDSRHQCGTLGFGYAGKAAGRLLIDLPGLNVYNRGVGGNNITGMVDRWQEDALDLKPTVVSILIGINDAWGHSVLDGSENGTSLEEYNTVYRQVLDNTRAALPGVRFAVCEPFVTQAGDVPGKPLEPEFEQRRAIAKQIAEDYDVVWVPFQALFDELCTKADPAYWAYDGIHPTAASHQAMADFWLQHVMGG